MSSAIAAVDLGKSRCRLTVEDERGRVELSGDGAPGLATREGVSAAFAAIRALLDSVGRPIGALGVGAAGAWAAPDAAAELARMLVRDVHAGVAVTSDVVSAHVGALAGDTGILLIAGTGAAALGVDDDGVRLVDGWGPELGDFGSGSWIGREALRAVLRASVGLVPETRLVATIAEQVGGTPGIAGWLAGEGHLPRRLATFAPAVLDAAAAGDPVGRGIAEEAIRLLTASAAAASSRTVDTALHGGVTDHDWFRSALGASLTAAGLRVVRSEGDALDGALRLARRPDLPHERFVHRAG